MNHDLHNAPIEFQKRVSVDDAGCWLWTAGRFGTGYGFFWWGRRSYRTHCFAYRWFNGEIPTGLHTHHTCGVRHCVNPSHVVLLTPTEHVRLHMADRYRDGGVTHCKHGHPFDERNTYTTKGGKRQCRTCNRDRKRASVL